jgi:ribonuclease HII
VTAHVKALRKLGATPIHRRSFAPVREVLGLQPLPPWPEPDDTRADPDLAAPPSC